MKFRCELSNSQAHISPHFSLAITDKQHCACSLPLKTVDYIKQRKEDNLPKPHGSLGLAENGTDYGEKSAESYGMKDIC